MPSVVPLVKITSFGFGALRNVATVARAAARSVRGPACQGMHRRGVGVVGRVEIHERIDHRLRPQCGRGAIQIGERRPLIFRRVSAGKLARQDGA